MVINLWVILDGIIKFGGGNMEHLTNCSTITLYQSSVANSAFFKNKNTQMVLRKDAVEFDAQC